MNLKTTITWWLVVGVVIFAIIITQHREDRTALKSAWFWVGFSAVWIFWAALTTALVNESAGVKAKKEQFKNDN